MRAAIIELMIDPTVLSSTAKLGHTDALVAALRHQPKRRESIVKAALKQAVDGGAAWIVFPGWTVVGKSAPAWMVAGSKGRTIAFECLSPAVCGPASRASKTVSKNTVNDRDVAEFSRPWRTFVARDGAVVVDAVQRLATARRRAVHGRRLIADLQAGDRYFDGGVLWICGEIEILEGGGRSNVRNGTGLPEGALRRTVVLNPAHTKEGPQPSRDKREWLSKGGWLFKSANTFTGGWSYWVDGGAEAGYEDVAWASHVAAAAWRNGAPVSGQRCSYAPVGSAGEGRILWVEMR